MRARQLRCFRGNRGLLDYEDVIKGNLEVHRLEAAYYDFLHPEIWNRNEQKRLRRALKYAVGLVESGNSTALDFGSGTGNCTKKLLNLGFKVTAVDLSPEMCMVLRSSCKSDVQAGNLEVLNLNLDEAEINKNFDLITCYSVLHHLPDYLQTIRRLANLVKSGGVLFVDHESSGHDETKEGLIGRLLLKSYYFINGLLESGYLKLHSINVPFIDYRKSDVHRTLRWECITKILRSEGFKIEFRCYYPQLTRFTTPLNFFHKKVTGKRNVMLLAKKAC